MTIEAPEIPTQTQPPADGDWAPAPRPVMAGGTAANDAPLAGPEPRQSLLGSLRRSRSKGTDRPDAAEMEEKLKPAKEHGKPKKSKEPKQAEKARSREGTLPRAALFVIVPFFVVYYLAFFSGATIGQAFVLSSEKVTSSLPGEHSFELDFVAAAVIGGMLEFASVGLMIISLIVRIEGERGTIAKTFSYALAFIAVALNCIGHLWIEDVFGAIVFTFCSVVAFVSGGLMIEFFMRQIQIARGRRLVPRPAYPLGLRLKQPQLVRLAGELFDADPKLELLGSLAAARAKIEAERKETERIEREQKTQAARKEEEQLIESLLFEMAFDEYGDETAAKIQVLADGPAATVKHIVEMGDPLAAAHRVRARMNAQREQNANSRIRRIAADVAGENLSNPMSNNSVEAGSKFGRIMDRINPRKPIESRSNSEPMNPSNGVSNSSRKSAKNSPTDPVESESNPVEEINLSGLGYDERKERARDYLWSLIKNGTPFDELPTGGQIERKFNIATASSRGGTGNSIKKQIEKKLNEHITNGNQSK